MKPASLSLILVLAMLSAAAVPTTPTSQQTCNLPPLRIDDGCHWPPGSPPLPPPPLPLPCISDVAIGYAPDDDDPIFTTTIITVTVSHPEYGCGNDCDEDVVIVQQSNGNWESITGRWNTDCGQNEAPLAKVLTETLQESSCRAALQTYGQPLPEYLNRVLGEASGQEIRCYRIFLPVVEAAP